MNNYAADSNSGSILDLVDFVLDFRPLYLQMPYLRNIRRMTYENAITYFTDHEPPLPFAKAAMVLEQAEDGAAFFTQVFLDEANNLVCDQVRGVPYGRRCLIRSMDDELSRLFGTKQVVLVK